MRRHIVLQPAVTYSFVGENFRQNYSRGHTIPTAACASANVETEIELVVLFLTPPPKKPARAYGEAILAKLVKLNWPHNKCAISTLITDRIALSLEKKS